MKKIIVFLKLFFAVSFLCLNVTYSYEASLMPTREKVDTLETEHFLILYQTPLSDAVTGLASTCEEAFYIITGVLGWTPREKTTVLFMDISDSHNGWATPIPHNTIAIYAAGSEQGSTIYQPGNYLRRTVFHEMMHTFSMDMRQGYNYYLSRLFGKVVPMGDFLSPVTFLLTASPVMLSPRWFLEGTAIWSETEFAGPGRGRSTMVDMIFRNAVKDNNLLPYSEWYIATPHWPYGNSAYLYGMRMVQYMYEKDKSANPVGDLVENVSKSFLFNFSRGFYATTREPWKRMAEEMLDNEKAVQTEKLGILSQSPLTQIKRLTPKDIAVGFVQYSDDEIYFIGAEEKARNTLFSYDPNTRTFEKIHKSTATPPMGALSVDETGDRIFYTRLEYRDLEDIWYEVRAYNIENGDDELITRDGRYRSVDVSPDGKMLATVSQRQAKTYLLEVPVSHAGEKGHEEVLFSSSLEQDIASPRYSPDGRSIVFVYADGNLFHLNLLDLSKKEVVTLWSSPSQIISPIWHPKERDIIFSSDANGVYNLYQIDTSGPSAPVPITNVDGGLFFPSFAADGRSMAVVNYDGFGPHLAIIPYNPDLLVMESLQDIRPDWAGNKIAKVTAEAKKKRETFKNMAKNGDIGEYNSFARIRPDFWSPWLLSSNYGLEAGAIASLSDPAAYQNLTLMVGIESEYGSPLASANYSYRGLGPELILYAGADQEVYPDLLVEQNTGSRFDYGEETRFIGTAVSYPIWNRLERQLIGTLGYTYRTRDGIDEAEDIYRDHDLEAYPSLYSESPLWGRLSYLSSTVFNRSVSFEDGSLASISAEQYIKELGGDIKATRLRADFNQYISVPVLENHVIKLHGAYGHGWGDDTVQGLFGVGGLREILNDSFPGVQKSLYLRGYDSNFQTGQRAFTGGVSYRFPIWNIFKGHESGFPVYTRSLNGELFYEGGRTWDKSGSGDDFGWLNAIGTEINFGMTMIRYLYFSPGIGVVYAPQNPDGDSDENEDWVVYLSIKGWYDQ